MTLVNTPQRQLPFLQRNWNQGVGDWSATADGFIKTRAGYETRNSAEAENRPSKRLRLGKDATPELSEIPSIDDVLLPKDPHPSPRLLRVDILKIVHKDSERRVKPSVSLSNLDTPPQPLTNLLTIRASCKITILDNSPLCKHAPPVLYCNSQPCTIKTFKNPVGSSPMARVYLEQPFFVPDQTLKIVREDGSYDLADNYRLDVELTAADGKEWPPLDLTIPPERNSQGARRWVLLACLVDLFKRSRMSVDLYMHQYTRECILRTSYIVDIDARWSTGCEQRPATPEKGVMSSITVNVADPNTGAINGTDANGVPTPDTLVNGTSNSSVNGFVRDGSEDPEGDTTPNRALRTRGNRVYNLKLLSDKAQGKSKGGRRRKRDDGQITYVLPNDQFSLDSYRCVACGVAHQSLQILQFHLQSSHPEFSYELRTTKGSQQFRVTHNYDWFPPSEEFHFTRSSRPLSLEEATDPALEPQKSLKPLPAGAAIKRPALPKPPVKKPPKKIFVPQTKQPLYDSVSRARLEPGTELIPPQSDDRWWIQKHRDIISDFVDIELPEREYILAWDKFVLPKRLSSEIFVPRVLLEFLQAKAVWIVSSEQREEEFFKHLAYLQLRDVVDQPTLDEINLILQDARAARANKEGSAEDQEEDEPEEVWKREQPTCLICGSPPVGAICTLVCSNAACGHHFHLTCLQDGIRMRPTEENWLCNSCVDEMPPAEPQDAPANVPQDAA